jgi:hypothetical protein
LQDDVTAAERLDVAALLQAGEQCVVLGQSCYRRGSLSSTSACSHAVQTISSPMLPSGRVLVGGLFFRHHLVVAPSETLLGVSVWIRIIRSGLPLSSPGFTTSTS